MYYIDSSNRAEFFVISAAGRVNLPESRLRQIGGH